MFQLKANSEKEKMSTCGVASEIQVDWKDVRFGKVEECERAFLLTDLSDNAYSSNSHQITSLSNMPPSLLLQLWERWSADWLDSTNWSRCKVRLGGWRKVCENALSSPFRSKRGSNSARTLVFGDSIRTFSGSVNAMRSSEQLDILLMQVQTR